MFKKYKKKIPFNFLKKNQRGQIWVETVIYTLIAFVMISLVLVFANPRINELQDKAVIDQSVSIMEKIDTIIEDIINVPGNKRFIDLSIKKGTLNIDGLNDLLIFEIESAHIYSQPGEDIVYGGVVVHTQKKGELNTVTLTANYSTYNITFQKDDESKLISKSSTPYKLFITNNGGNPINIDFELG